MCVLGVLVLSLFLYKTVRRKSFCFWKTLCKYCWWKINICCTPSFHLSLEMMKKTMIFMNNSGDVDDAEADYTCPSWIRAFDVRCIFVGGVVRSGQEKQREGVIPDISQAHCSNTATYLLPPHTSRKLTVRYVAPIVASVIYAIKHLCGFFFVITNHQKPECSPAMWEHCSPPLWSHSAPVAWHHISPCLLIGLGIYCNAIVLDGIGPVLTLMMPSSLNLESLLLCWRPYMGMGMYGGWSRRR